MNRERFYLPSLPLEPTSVQLENEEHHHLSHVFRVREGETVELVNGSGSIANALVTHIEKKKTLLQITSLQKQEKDPFSISLAIPWMRPSKLDWIIEKGTELGADAFIFYTAEKSKQEPLKEKAKERIEHLLIAAMKQSKRLYLPQIKEEEDLSKVIQAKTPLFFGDIDPKTSPLPSLLPKELLFITGPESGFSLEEKELLATKATGVSLNPHILRAETAPIAALAILVHAQLSALPHRRSSYS